MGHRLTDAHVREDVRLSAKQRRVIVAVAEHDDPRFDPREHVDTIGGIYTVSVLHRHRVDQIDVTGKQGRNSRGRVLDRCEDGLGHVVLDLAPPAVIGHEDRLQIRLARLQHERRGAVDVTGGVILGVARRPFGIIGRGPVAVHHHPVGDGIRKDRLRRGCENIDGVVVHHFDAGYRGEPTRNIAVLRTCALVAEQHVICVESRAVVEGHAFTQVETPAGAVRQRLPRFCQSSLDRHVTATAHEAFVDVVEKTQNRSGGYRVGVHCLRVCRRGPAEGLGLRRDGGGKRKDARGNKAVHLLSLPRGGLYLRRGGAHWPTGWRIV
mmetsp:Transcript_7319/g.12808  ORF Transcript_7319/g.12808 Transcript_7319/m.12808 type:complete len:323 (-) Transcript_7319:71-1039(-)